MSFGFFWRFETLLGFGIFLGFGHFLKIWDLLGFWGFLGFWAFIWDLETFQYWSSSGIFWDLGFFVIWGFFGFSMNLWDFLKVFSRFLGFMGFFNLGFFGMLFEFGIFCRI